MDTEIVIMISGSRDWQKYKFLKPETDNIEFVYSEARFSTKKKTKQKKHGLKTLDVALGSF